MINQKLQTKLEKILPTVQVPGRYTGGEFNQTVKNWHDIDLSIALLFPDIYDLGMSNLGLMILYDLINQNPNFAAERVFLPWSDMEKAMRLNEIPLYSLETKNPLSNFDISYQLFKVVTTFDHQLTTHIKFLR